jgi:hypothetical protein
MYPTVCLLSEARLRDEAGWEKVQCGMRAQGGQVHRAGQRRMPGKGAVFVVAMVLEGNLLAGPGKSAHSRDGNIGCIQGSMTVNPILEFGRNLCELLFPTFFITLVWVMIY